MRLTQTGAALSLLALGAGTGAAVAAITDREHRGTVATVGQNLMFGAGVATIGLLTVGARRINEGAAGWARAGTFALLGTAILGGATLGAYAVAAATD